MLNNNWINGVIMEVQTIINWLFIFDLSVMAFIIAALASKMRRLNTEVKDLKMVLQATTGIIIHSNEDRLL